jgi:peptidoglycan/LPS O-acetylase OafA/YrhL
LAILKKKPMNSVADIYIPNQDERERLPNNLDALRGLAVFSVVCNHLSAHAGMRMPFFGELGGLLGVQLFFLISGYLIIQSASRYTLAAYVVRRLLRIFPAYWVAVLGLSLLQGKLDSQALGSGLGDFLWNLMAQSHWVPSALLHYDVLTVSWTLTVELAWYAVAPLLVWLAPRHRSVAFWLCAMGAALAVSSAWVWAAHGGRLDSLYAAAIARAGVSPVNDFMRFAFIVNAFPAQLVFFVIGCLLWRFETALAGLPSWLLCVAVAVFAGWPTQWNALVSLNPSFLSGVGLAGLFLLALRQPRLRFGFPHWLGRVSYSVYLLHVPIIIAVFQTWKITGWPGLCVAMALLGVMSTALHHAVERPCIVLGKRLVSRLGSCRPPRSSYP